jgi:hypothetical protein
LTEVIEQGVRRVTELENLLGEVLDLYNQNELVEVDKDGLATPTTYTEDVMERIGVVLDRDDDTELI